VVAKRSASYANDEDVTKASIIIMFNCLISPDLHITKVNMFKLKGSAKYNEIFPLNYN